MKNLFLLLILSITAGLQGQNLEQYIPKESQVIVEIGGDNIFNLIELQEISNMLPPDPSGMPMNLEDIGVSVKDKAYYFFSLKEGIYYHNVLLKVSDAGRLATTLEEQMPVEPISLNGYKVIMEETMTIGWNNDLCLFTVADVPKVTYTMDDLLEEKRQNNDTVDFESIDFELMMKNLEAPFILSEDEIAATMKNGFSALTSLPSEASILSSPSFQEGRKENSVLYFTLQNIDELMVGMLPEELLTSLPTTFEPSMMMGYERISGNMIFGEKEVKISMITTVEDAMAEIMHKVYLSPEKNSIGKYMKDEDALGYFSFQMDMGNMLKEYPTLIDNMYGNMLPDFREEIDVATDLFSIILDEDAIGKLITGNMLMVLHDVEEKEVTYTSYEYDEEYNSTEVTKTKKEPIPIFTMMMGSENEAFFKKLVKISEKYGLSEKANKYHKLLLEDTGLPFNLFFSHQNDLVFLSNSETRIQKSFIPQLTVTQGVHQQRITDNVLNFYIDLSKGIDKAASIFPIEEPMAEKIEILDEFYMTMGDIQGNSMEMEMVLKTQGNDQNTLKTILDLLKQ